jgi:3-hydroxybutyryl-CoA dehydrogenase
MGSGIALVAAQAGFKTILFDVNSTVLEKSSNTIESNLQNLVTKGKLTDEQRTGIIHRIFFTGKIEDCKAEMVIEAIIEDKQAKVELLEKIARLNDENTILATNTSSLSISSIAADLPDSSRVIGMHFFNPAPVLKLVEIVQGQQTSAEVVKTVFELAKRFGKIPVVCKDVPGFIVNRVARQYYLEALKLVEEGLAEVQTVDEIMEASGFKMGPFKLMDLIGLDINFSVSNIVWESLGKPSRLTPSILQKQKVEAGELGVKSGKGFYTYSKKNEH